ncbi:hypothetical protein [Rhodocyclus gracilis]|uniref:hypothetical protein n=1 Tax=Rhodocyclus gracilis TaxID=2929842 RepID=UPI001297C539|nr:hypothetical protein [Rhodocyclus gracilis]
MNLPRTFCLPRLPRLPRFAAALAPLRRPSAGRAFALSLLAILLVARGVVLPSSLPSLPASSPIHVAVQMVHGASAAQAGEHAACAQALSKDAAIGSAQVPNMANAASDGRASTNGKACQFHCDLAGAPLLLPAPLVVDGGARSESPVSRPVSVLAWLAPPDHPPPIA